MDNIITYICIVFGITAWAWASYQHGRRVQAEEDEKIIKVIEGPDKK